MSPEQTFSYWPTKHLTPQYCANAVLCLHPLLKLRVNEEVSRLKVTVQLIPSPHVISARTVPLRVQPSFPNEHLTLGWMFFYISFCAFVMCVCQ